MKSRSIQLKSIFKIRKGNNNNYRRERIINCISFIISLKDCLPIYKTDLRTFAFSSSFDIYTFYTRTEKSVHGSTDFPAYCKFRSSKPDKCHNGFLLASQYFFLQETKAPQIGSKRACSRLHQLFNVYMIFLEITRSVIFC